MPVCAPLLRVYHSNYQTHIDMYPTCVLGPAADKTGLNENIFSAVTKNII
jgi:hypothetical protein